MADALTDTAPAVQPTAPAPRPVRLALLLDGLAQPAWVAEVLDCLAAEGTAVLVGVGVGGGQAPAGRALGYAYAAYRRLDARRYGRPDDLTRLVDLTPHFGGVSVTEVPGASVGDRWAPNDDGIARVRAFDADVVWYLGRAPLAEPTSELGRQGVWTFDPVHGSDGARAVSKGRPTTTTVLRRLACPVVAGETIAVARTSTKAVSVLMNQAEHVRHVAALFEGAIGRAYRAGSAALAVPSVRPEGDAQHDPLATGEVVRMVARVMTRLVSSRVQNARTTRRWILAYHFSDADHVGTAPDHGEPSTDPRAFTELVPPPDRYWADPFPAMWGGRHYVFYEEHLAGIRDAHLSVAELDPSRGFVNPRVVLRRPYHLSFPSVFRWNDEWYMTPETSTEETVQLYRAEQFPDGWTYIGDLLRGARFVDPVIAHVDERWWMFVGVLPPAAMEATVLHVYHADTPLGPWVPHAHNPALVDVRAARPAGRVFERGGVYYRPVQDGAPHYGYAMTIHRIDVLTPTEFSETPVERVEPTWSAGLVGTHTLNAAGRLTVIDALRRGPRAPRR